MNQEKFSRSPVNQINNNIRSSPSKENLITKKKSILKNAKDKTPTKPLSPRKKKDKEGEKSVERKIDRGRSKSSSNLKPQSPAKRK